MKRRRVATRSTFCASGMPHAGVQNCDPRHANVREARGHDPRAAMTGNRYQRLLSRRALPGQPTALSAKVANLQETDDIKYVLGAMEPLDAEYTRTCLGEADRVKRHLEPFATIRLQGSVTTN